MQQTELSVGDIVQINPEHDYPFGGCLMVVTEPKPWGAQGYCTSPEKPGSAFYCRVKFENMEPTGGRASWVFGMDEEVAGDK